MRSGILGADRGLEWHRGVAPVWEVGEITTHGLALSRLKHGFESRWGTKLVSLRFPPVPSSFVATRSAEDRPGRASSRSTNLRSSSVRGSGWEVCRGDSI